MSYFNRIKANAKLWQRDEDGSVAVETVLMVPLLAWAMLATLTYFDAYRNESINYKAGLVIADAVSREAEVNDAFVDGMYGLLKFMMLKDDTPDLRISVFSYDADSDKYNGVWSEARGSRQPLASSEVDGIRGRLPVMVGGEKAILVETWSDYDPPYAVGLESFDQVTYNVISPRFLPQICFASAGDVTC